MQSLKTEVRELVIRKINSLPHGLLRFVQNKIVYEPKIRELKKLGEGNPGNVPIFDAIFFEVRTRCNSRCAFCAASIQNETREDVSLPFELYQKAIDELSEMNYSGRIAYHVNNDPLIFRELEKFVDYARTKVPKAWIQILTNGKALTLAKAEALIKVGINEITVNHYNDDFSAPLPKVLQELREAVLLKYFKADEIVARLPKDYKEKKVFLFAVNRRRLNEVLMSRAGTAPNKKEVSEMPRGFCQFPFTQFNVTADGRVNKCCSDLFFSDVMGNIKDQSIREIWFGEKLNKVRKELLQGNRKAFETCEKCDFYGCKNSPNKLVQYFMTATRERLN